jgi:hypothetical protein
MRSPEAGVKLVSAKKSLEPPHPKALPFSTMVAHNDCVKASCEQSHGVDTAPVSSPRTGGGSFFPVEPT